MSENPKKGCVSVFGCIPTSTADRWNLRRDLQLLEDQDAHSTSLLHLCTSTFPSSKISQQPMLAVMFAMSQINHVSTPNALVPSSPEFDVPNSHRSELQGGGGVFRRAQREKHGVGRTVGLEAWLLKTISGHASKRPNRDRWLTLWTLCLVHESLLTHTITKTGSCCHFVSTP